MASGRSTLGRGVAEGRILLRPRLWKAGFVLGRDHRSLAQPQASQAAASTDAQVQDPPQYLAIATAFANDGATDSAGSLRAGRRKVQESKNQKATCPPERRKQRQSPP